MLRKTQKQFQEYFLVATGNQSMRTSGSFFGSANALNLTSGQLGVIRPELSTYIDGTNDAVSNGVLKIQILQGTSKSADTSSVKGWAGLETPAYNASPVINANTIQQVATNLPVVGTYSSLLYSGLSNPTADTKYSLNVKMRSVRKDKEFGSNIDQFSSVYTTGASAPTTAVVLSNLITKLNNYSKANNLIPPHLFMGNKKNVIAFGIDTDGSGSGQAIGTLVTGNTINVMTDGTNTMTLTLTKEMIQTIKGWIDSTPLTATSEIVNVSTASTGSSDVDSIIVMGLDHDQALAYDDVMHTRVSVKDTTITWPDGTYTETTLTDAIESTGSGRYFKIWFDERAFGQHGNEQLAGFTDTIIRPYNPIDETLSYTATAIDFLQEEFINNDISHQNVRVWILLPATDDSGSATGADGITTSTSATTTVTALNTILGAWLLSNDKFTINGDASSSALFV